jgi:RHS repeat-associated protein
LVRQISAKGDTSTYVYDDIGRASISNDQRGNLYYSYIADDTNLAFGKPDSIYNGDKSLLEVYEYESDYGRLVSEKRTQVGKTFTHTYVYDWFGRPLTRTYPSGFEVRYAYTSNGDLEKVTGGGFTLWSCSDVNALGQITAYSQGANSTSLSYDMHGVLNHVTTGSIVDMQYGFDDLGNLTLREDALTNQKEVFEYDNLSRLTGIEYYLNNIHQSAQDFSTGYDNCGNITSKTGVSSSILYGEDAGPHALTTIETPESTYKPPPQGISYNCFNKVATISDTLTGGIPLTLDFTYGLSNQRIKMVQTRNSTIERVKYFNGDYEEDSTSAGVKKYHYIQGGNGLTAIFVKSGSDNDTMYYVLSDHLGSLTTIVNAETSVVENYSFNAWGMPRDASDWTQSYAGDLFAGRGFTGHEHLMDFNLINMNGRIYDPVLGRFLSPDPYVQAPGYPNNYNRYTYALNNPLRFTDPSGYKYGPSDYEREIINGEHTYYNWEAAWKLGGNRTPFASIMANSVTGGWVSDGAGGVYNRFTGERASGADSGGDFISSIVDPSQYTSYEWGMIGTSGWEERRGKELEVYAKPVYGWTESNPASSNGGDFLSSAPEQDFDGFWGGLKYFWTGGNIDGYHYNWKGKADGLAPVMGVAPSPGKTGIGLKAASKGFRLLFKSGIQGNSIINIRSTLLNNGFTQSLTKNKSGYLFTNTLGEQVRIMHRGGAWDVRIMNQFGNYLDNVGNIGTPGSTHNLFLIPW